MKIGYIFRSKGFLKTLGITRLNIYLSGYNLLTFDKIKYFDPETKINNDILYPITQTYNFGVVVNF